MDKLSLNNMIQDATMMKDYLAYTLMARMDVPSSLCSYVQISVNGEAWGLYLAVEGVEDSFMDRNGMTKANCTSRTACPSAAAAATAGTLISSSSA